MILIISFLVYGAYVSYSIFKNLMDNNYANIDMMVDVNVESIEQKMELIRGITFALSGSDSVDNWRQDQGYFSRGDKNSFLNQEKLNQEMQKILTNNNVWNFELFDYITIYENEKLLAYSYTKPLSTQMIINSSGKVYEQIKDCENYVLTIPPEGYDHTIYTTLRIQMDFQEGDSLYIIGATNESYLGDMLKNVAGYEGAMVFISDKEGVIYSSNTGKLLGGKIPEPIRDAMAGTAEQSTGQCSIADKFTGNGSTGKKVTMDGTDYVMIQRPVNKEFTFVYLFPRAELIKQTLLGMREFLIVSALLVIILIGIATLVIMHLTEFIKDFINAMIRVRNRNYETKMERYGNQALDELVDTFNLMTGELNSLIKTTYESKILLTEMEIKSLQHQMNPHFLFNILLTIQIRAKMSGDETLYRMISSLSSLLRAGIYGDKRSLITIREELKYVDYYLWLQKERYEDRLTYTINVADDSILECEIPRLVIEPMVENAIVHGVETKPDQASVLVTVEYEGDDILIHVIDNGIGFDAAALQKKEAEETEDKAPKREKMGMQNVNQRIKLMYGDAYGLTVNSQENVGTDIEIRIPGKKMEITDDSSDSSR